MSAMGFSANSGAVSSIKEWDLVLISEMKLLVENELRSTSLKHEAFVLGTSETKHDNGAFEIFITTAPIPDLNEKLAVFGKVVKGGDIVQVKQTSISFRSSVLRWQYFVRWLPSA
ncbi:hypothetical protein V6N11_024903 [Hibiscus sabdariffa]|uniref:PPIase cyclophilin-type domain-containing protein n=1 Tax=Hibiscus sabdariffa TaxID=183260 RepID=A0ABR2QNH4_9ROSI